MRNAGLAKCVEHCVHQAGHRAGDPGLAHAFGAERVGLGRHRMIEEREVVHQERARHRVVHEAAVQQLAAVRVIDRLLAENVAGALGDAALHLSFDDLVVDDVAGVVAGDVADDLGDAGFHLDLDLGDVAAVGERRPDLLFLQVHVEPAGMLAGQRRQRDLAVGALDAVFALQELDVGRRGLQFLRRKRETFLDHLLRRHQHHASHAKKRARASGGIADQVHVRVGGAQADRFHRHAEHAGNDLRVRRFVALAVRMRCRAQGNARRVVPRELYLVVGREAARAARLDVGGDALPGRLRGQGIATYIEASGAGGFAPYDQVQITWDDAARITLRATSHSHGQGHETTYAQIVSGVLGVPMESIRLRTADPDMQLVGNPTGGSRSLLGVGSVVLMASQEVARKGLALAAEELEAAPADVEFLEGKYRIKGTDREVALAALARKHPGRLDVDLKEKKVGTTFPNGCHIAEVEIEVETGIAEIVRYVACDDAGNIINHQIVEGQMQGGITQGAGHIFGEQAIYDPDSGQLLNGSFMDYPMPRALLVNNLTLLDHPVPTQTNPLGAKGVGEAGVTGSMPCLMNAVLDALRQAGVTHFDMPATPQRVWRALQAAKAGDPRALAVAELSGHS